VNVGQIPQNAPWMEAAHEGSKKVAETYGTEQLSEGKWRPRIFKEAKEYSGTESALRG